jgi:nitrogen fixation-related uncharacterized protein
MEAMFIMLGLLVAVVVLDLAAWRWGCDSCEHFDSQEWERRRQWRN